MTLFKRTLMNLLHLGALMCAVSAQAAYPLVVEHGQGKLTLDQAPTRVAVFDLGVLDTLDALGIAAAGVPQMAGPAYLKAKYEGRKTVNVGTLFEPDQAALERLKPDLIIIAGRSSNQFETLSALAPTIDLSIAPDHFLAGVRGNLQLLGEIFDKQEQAAQLQAQLNKELAAVHAKSAGLSSLTLFTVNDALMLHAPGERFGMLNEVLDTRSVVESVDPASVAQGRPAPDSPEARQLRERQQVRLDAALKEQPQWLVILDRGAATGGEGKADETLGKHAGIAASKAWADGKVFYLDPATWYIATGGYQGLMSTLKDFAAAQ
ncbi:siderophore ABC transporter substrate-binding protein [Ectopseudomonas alcaliphila]|uniref:siderophore ABC transporter substrate-binding protein n=1 Tax=Ectopseudomonas alcaliphila TaxID=101564 RepID=UPI0027801984|nr:MULTISPECIES: ABC transporter substrate-binding protein [Pseudomonas]MDP9939959.1 iron complex transport system substrate-binding protein [Pseudomonas sp. 3400]MDR7012474.1 iron complex transport system substrate-binding protein [Pseudomonas alcaliphila]